MRIQKINIQLIRIQHDHWRCVTLVAAVMSLLMNGCSTTLSQLDRDAQRIELTRTQRAILDELLSQDKPLRILTINLRTDWQSFYVYEHWLRGNELACRLVRQVSLKGPSVPFRLDQVAAEYHCYTTNDKRVVAWYRQLYYDRLGDAGTTAESHDCFAPTQFVSWMIAPENGQSLLCSRETRMVYSIEHAELLMSPLGAVEEWMESEDKGEFESEVQTLISGMMNAETCYECELFTEMSIVDRSLMLIDVADNEEHPLRSGVPMSP